MLENTAVFGLYGYQSPFRWSLSDNPQDPCPHPFDIGEDDLQAVMHTAKRVAMAIKASLAPDGMLVYQLNGRVAMQLVDHFHIHLVPRWENDGVDLSHGFQPGDPEKIWAIAAKIVGTISD